HLNVLINAPLKNKKEQKEHIEFVVNVFLNGINSSKA
ncbi:TetR/AcrR family transcriptional regulator, partial [Campylobacter jejuni]|nr:TetR/AcrR family transcriptional regulator [Campylobacter jejuni]